MGKFWGNNDGDTTRRKGSRNFKRYQLGPNKRNVFMRLTDATQIQRKIIARHLLYLSQPEVFEAKRTHLDFEEHVKQFKKFPLIDRIPSVYSKPNCCRKKKVLGNKALQIPINENQEDEVESQTTDGRISEFDFEALSYKPYQCTRMKTSEYLALKNSSLRRKWLKWAFLDMNSTPVNEIVSNHRMVTLDDTTIRWGQTYFTIFLESARHALKIHEWPILNQSLLGMVRTFPISIKCPSVLWTLGFFAIINQCKDDLQVLRQFLTHATTLVRGFRTWLGLQAGIWFIQKGYFNEGLELVKEWHIKSTRESGIAYLGMQPGNPKKDMILFLTELIIAMMRYSTWKRESQVIRDDDYNVLDLDHEETLQRAGDSALTGFEYVYKHQTETNADVMSFIEPFVELLVEYRSANRAKEIVEEVYNNNVGNMFVENFYINFMEKHFPHECTTEEFSERKNKFISQFNYNVDRSEGIKGRLRIQKLRAAKRKAGNLVRLNSIPKPEFSWD